MNRSLNLLLSTLCTVAGLSLADAAQAQSFGTYVGSTTEGDSVEITVGDDGFGGPMITGALVFWTATCTESGSRGVAWGIGASQPIVNGKATLEFRGNPLYERFRLKFERQFR